LKSRVIFLQPCELTVGEGNSVGNYAESLMGRMMVNRNGTRIILLASVSSPNCHRRKICRNLLPITNLLLM